MDAQMPIVSVVWNRHALRRLHSWRQIEHASSNNLRMPLICQSLTFLMVYFFLYFFFKLTLQQDICECDMFWYTLYDQQQNCLWTCAWRNVDTTTGIKVRLGPEIRPGNMDQANEITMINVDKHINCLKWNVECDIKQRKTQMCYIQIKSIDSKSQMLGLIWRQNYQLIPHNRNLCSSKCNLLQFWSQFYLH